MDTGEGDEQAPLSLHKYLYASSDPLDRIDPSGNESLAELTEAIGDQLTIAARTTVNVMKIYNNTRSIIDLINVSKQFLSLWQTGGIEQAIRDQIRNSRKEWQDLALNGIEDDLGSNLGRIIMDMGTYTAEALATRYGRAPDAFGIDLPVPFPMPKFPAPLGNLPDTNLKAYMIF